MNDSEHASRQDENDLDAETGNGSVESLDENRTDERPPREIGGRRGPDPVRYGDWEKNGRCIDF